MTLAFLGAEIPVEKFNHPMLRAWFSKHTNTTGCSSALGHAFPKHNCLRLFDGQLDAIRRLSKDKMVP